MICAFQGVYRFLSNFWPCQVRLDGEVYPSVEHAYQAAKTLVEDERTAIRTATTPGNAKRLGKRVTMRADWDLEKVQVMLDLVRQKFSNPELKQMLLDTGDSDLIEGNTWGDTYWGVCNGKGENNLGKILMQVRQEIEDRA